MSERPKDHVLKTCEVKASVGSNPTRSADGFCGGLGGIRRKPAEQGLCPDCPCMFVGVAQYPSSLGAPMALPVASIVNHTPPMPWPLVSPGAVSAA